MNWELFYLVCFFVGLGLSALAFLGGAFHMHLPFRMHLPGRLHVPHVAHHASAADLPFFNTTSIMAFLCWFGGMGYLLMHYGHFWFLVAFVLSTAFGLGGAALMFFFLAKVVLSHESPLNPDDFEMVGVVGVISSGIRAGGTGELIYLQQGTRRVCGARSQEGAAIAKGCEVVVTGYEQGIAFVRPWNEFAEEHHITTADNTAAKA